MEVIDGSLTPERLRAMADEMEGREPARPGYMRRVEVDGIALDVDMRVVKDVRTLRLVGEIQKGGPDSAFKMLDLFDLLLGDKRAEVEGKLADADGFTDAERYMAFCEKVFEAVGAKN